MRLLHCTCLLLTQSGHGAVPYRTSFKPLRCLVLSLGGGNETARVHHASRRRGSQLAARGARAAARASAAHRRARGRPRTIRNYAAHASRRSCRRCSNWAGPTAATCGSTIAGPEAMPTTFANTRRNWSRSRRTSSWPLAARPWSSCLQATRTVPIVFVIVPDPVGAGFVDSLSRPGGNATGFMLFEYSLSGEMAGTAQADRAGRDASGGPSGSRHNRRDRPVRRHPVRGAVARRGGEPGQRARRRRDRARRHGLRALLEWRPDRDGERVGGGSSRSDRHACGPAQTARGLLRPHLRHRRRPDLLWALI